MNYMQEALVAWMDKIAIPEWRKALKFLSVQWSAICIVALPVWMSLTDEQRQAFLAVLGIQPAWYVVAGAVVSIYLRLKSQPALHQDEKPEEKADA